MKQKQLLKTLFAWIALSLFMPINAYAQYQDGDTFTAKTIEGVEMTFKVLSAEEKTCQVGKGDLNQQAIPSNTSGTITIPETVSGFTVTCIGSYAFRGCTGLTSFNIPNLVTCIESYAFWDCTGMTSINIPNSVTSIGEHAFLNCTGLTSIEIPNSVTSIGSYAFLSCTGLTSIEIPNSVTGIGGDVFRGCTGLTSINIPNSVTSIGIYAFRDCI
jgi:hypothetical protein